MSTPVALLDALAQLEAPSGLPAAVARLSERYRVGVTDGARGMRDELDRQAYVAARMPATSAAVAAALRQCQVVLPEITSVLDLGSGPGSALWAVADACPKATHFTAVERDAGLIAAGQDLLTSASSAVAATRWIAADLRQLPELEQHDLVVLSYVTNELTPTQRRDLITRAWALSSTALLVVETGTPRGFAACLDARSVVLAQGGHVVAPCPHAQACPLADHAERWCHFRVRVARSRLHKAAKGGALGYEDEPYSLLCASRRPLPAIAARVLSTPKVHRGAVDLTLCTEAGVGPWSIPRRERSRYDLAAKLVWGDAAAATLLQPVRRNDVEGSA